MVCAYTRAAVFCLYINIVGAFLQLEEFARIVCELNIPNAVFIRRGVGRRKRPVVLFQAHPIALLRIVASGKEHRVGVDAVDKLHADKFLFLNVQPRRSGGQLERLLRFHAQLIASISLHRLGQSNDTFKLDLTVIGVSQPRLHTGADAFVPVIHGNAEVLRRTV